MNFESFDLHPTVLAGLRALRYTTPTPLQTQVLPPALAGRDVIALAQSGAGTTAAFVLPILHRLRSEDKEGLRALVITPTRETAEQTLEIINRIGEQTGLESLAIYEGRSMEKQMRALRYRPAIIVTCAGRLLDHLWKGSIKLMDLEVLVIDGADRILEAGFLAEIRNILGYMDHRYQTLLSSATLPDDVRHLARDCLHDPITVQIDGSLPAKGVSSALEPVPHLRTELLKKTLGGNAADSVLVFTRTRRQSAQAARQLAKSGYRVSCFQGNLAKNGRPAGPSGFKDGTIKVLAVTDAASRGIDVRSISRSINGDQQGAGDAGTFVTEADERRIQELETMLASPLERLTLAGSDDGQVPPSQQATR